MCKCIHPTTCNTCYIYFPWRSHISVKCCLLEKNTVDVMMVNELTESSSMFIASFKLCRGNICDHKCKDWYSPQMPICMYYILFYNTCSNFLPHLLLHLPYLTERNFPFQDCSTMSKMIGDRTRKLPNSTITKYIISIQTFKRICWIWRRVTTL